MEPREKAVKGIALLLKASELLDALQDIDDPAEDEATALILAARELPKLKRISEVMNHLETELAYTVGWDDHQASAFDAFLGAVIDVDYWRRRRVANA